MSLQLLLVITLSLSVPAFNDIITGNVSSIGNTVTDINNIVNSVENDVASMEDNDTSSMTVLEEGVVYIASSQCQNVKQILGINYNQSDEPDLSKLTLDFYANNKVIKYNLSEISNITNSGFFNLSYGLIIYMHGFTDNPSKDSFQTLNNAFHAQGQFNILALDASDYISYFYLRASTLVAYIGAALGKGLVTLVQDGLNASTIHLIGHSLGSHIASFTGKTLYNLIGSKVGRISGLDPAGPCFSSLNASYRLNKTDAQFVDVIHTDAGIYGLNEVIGQVDYHPNNGTNQPGCMLDTCSHSRAWQFFAESLVNTTGFLAVKCDNWASFKAGNCTNNTQSFMGYGSKPGTTGQYYLRTNSTSPYALGAKGI